MKEGGKSNLFISSELGYGDNSMGDVIKPGSTLIFEVELLKVED
jgi:FKBP-type peptidyl-prolyl cis-trans isomerase